MKMYRHNLRLRALAAAAAGALGLAFDGATGLRMRMRMRMDRPEDVETNYVWKTVDDEGTVSPITDALAKRLSSTDNWDFLDVKLAEKRRDLSASVE